MKEILISKAINVNGNKVAVCYFTSETLRLLPSSKKLRIHLVNKYKSNVDTVMAISKLDDSAIKVLVFEPNSGSEFGSFSNMCGNGLRAIHQVTNSHVFITTAGTFFATKINDIDYICVRECKDIITLRPSQKREIEKIIYRPISCARLCGNFDNNPADGEPHLVILLKDYLGKDSLIQLAKKTGYILSKLISKNQVNVTFVSTHCELSKKIVATYTPIFACTFERNLGSDSKVAVTGSCGTGAIAAADTIQKFLCNSKNEFIINFPKDTQSVRIENNQTYILTKKNYESI